MVKITQQINEQECGICVLTSLHNHFYNEKLSKEQVLEIGYISDSGMTIFDFESTAIKLGLECESYEITYSEFINLKINSYFILLLSTGNSQNHYVIARKKNKCIEIYDSCTSKSSKLSYIDLQKIFLNTIILIKKKPNRLFSKLFAKTSTLLLFDLKFVLLNLFFSLLTLTLSVAGASLLNFVIDLSITTSSVNNLITICFIFILVYFCNEIFSYISELFMSRHVKNYLLLFTNRLLSNLDNKFPDFLKKVDKNWIFKIDEIIYNISNFCVIKINKFITNVVFSAVCICIIGTTQYYLLIFVVLYAIIEFIFFLFSYRKKQEMFIKIVRHENANIKYYKDLINLLVDEIWQNKKKTLIEKIKVNYGCIYKNYSNIILYKNNSNLLKSLLKNFVDISSIAAMSYLIIVQNKLSVGQLTFVVSTFALYKSSLADLFNYFLSKIEFDVYWQAYKDITQVGNLNLIPNNIQIEKIKIISFDNKTFFQSKHSNISSSQSIINQIKTCREIFINNQKFCIDKNLMKLIIVLDQKSKPSIPLLLKGIENKPEKFSKYLQYFNIDLNSTSFSFYENLILNFLNLLSEKNQIIFIDDVLFCIKKRDMLIIKQILLKVKQENTVFVIGKEGND